MRTLKRGARDVTDPSDHVKRVDCGGSCLPLPAEGQALQKTHRAAPSFTCADLYTSAGVAPAQGSTAHVPAAMEPGAGALVHKRSFVSATPRDSQHPLLFPLSWCYQAFGLTSIRRLHRCLLSSWRQDG